MSFFVYLSRYFDIHMNKGQAPYDVLYVLSIYIFEINHLKIVVLFMYMSPMLLKYL
jgi:hypothetical protein